MAASYDATIRRTEGGIPHIKARGYGSLAFGFGYAFAKDNICTIADAYVTVNAQRSRYFGPDGTYQQHGNGTEVNNLDSDFFWRQIIDSKVIEQLVAKPPPHGPVAEVKEGVRGYVAGYNRYLRDVGGADGIRDPRCKGKPWVRPITSDDAYRRFYQLILLASQGVAVDGIGGAQPPPPGSASSAARPSPQRLDRALDRSLGSTGSNAAGVGREGTRDRRHGLLLGNPHFPWIGTERFYQFQYTWPGNVRVSGATLFGVPLVLIGHTRTMAWSHTVSTAFRFTPYELKLVPGSPTTYLVDGRPEQMTSRQVTVTVRNSDGSLGRRSRRLYSTRWGPVMTELVGIPLPWTHASAFAMADANADNFRVFNHFYETNQAASVGDMLGTLRKYQGIPWVNTVAADKNGDSLYADMGAIPHVTNAKASDCNTPLGQGLFAAARLPVLDGSRSACAWGSDPDSIRPGLFGPSSMPHQFRDDFVHNANDSYWLTNPHQPIEGYSRIIGDERTPRSLRTRIGLIMMEDRVHGTDGRPAGFTRQDMQDALFSNRIYAGELTRDSVVQMCREHQALGGVAPRSDGPPVPIGNACDALAAWDVRADNGSRGALLFRRFWARAGTAAPNPWLRQFDQSDPIRTPNTLNTLHPQVRNALGDAIQDLRVAGIPFDAPLGDSQDVRRGGDRIPIHGGVGTSDGNWNALNAPFSRTSGVREPEHGSSYIQVVTWDDTPCPDAATILTYSLSEDPTSPWHSDQTRLYSRKKWLTGRFCEGEIAASPALRVKRVRSGQRRGRGPRFTG